MNFEQELLQLIEGYSKSESIGRWRLHILTEMMTHFQEHRYPAQLTVHQLSLIPSVFQEANYSDIWWGGQHEDLGHLESILQIDCMFHNNGKTRKELSEQQFSNYVDFSFDAIDALKAGSVPAKEEKTTGFFTRLRNWFTK